MRTGLLTAVAIAAAAFSGVAQASVITETFTGLINGGIDNGGNFGVAGASLTGDTIAFSFSYDTGLLQADVSAGTDGSVEQLAPGFYDDYYDYAGDSAFTESVTINSQTVTIANSDSNPNYGALQDCMPACGASDLSTLVQVGSGAYLEFDLTTTQDYSTGDNLFSQTEVNALVGGGVTTASIELGDDVFSDSLFIGNVNVETPEPTTWISLALGFGVVGLRKRRRGAR
jgi:hypothetical protein